MKIWRDWARNTGQGGRHGDLHQRRADDRRSSWRDLQRLTTPLGRASAIPSAIEPLRRACWIAARAPRAARGSRWDTSSRRAFLLRIHPPGRSVLARDSRRGLRHPRRGIPGAPRSSRAPRRRRPDPRARLTCAACARRDATVAFVQGGLAGIGNGGAVPHPPPAEHRCGEP